MFISEITTFTGKWDKPNVTYYIQNYDVDRNKTTMTDQTFFFLFFKFSALWQVQTSDGSTSPGFELLL